LQEAVFFFSDPQRTFDYAVKLRWPDGKVTCPRCQSTDYSFISTRRIWFCKDCKKQFTVKVGTIFEDSALGMDKWMIAVWLIVNCKNGISSYEVARALGITQTSAWFMMHRVRLAMQDRSLGKLGGPGIDVEADETFIGGKARNMHSEKRRTRITARGFKDKTGCYGSIGA
jgi:transposase-like protein